MTTKIRRLNRIRESALNELVREMEETVKQFQPIARRIFTPDELRILVALWRNPPVDLLAKIESDEEARAVWERREKIIAAARLLDGPAR